MHRAQRGLRSGETGKALREEGRPKQSPKEPLKSKCSFVAILDVASLSSLWAQVTVAGDMSPAQPRCGHLTRSHRTDVGMPSHSLLPAQCPSRAAPGCQVSHETLDNMGCAIWAPRVWRGEMQSSRVAEQAKVARGSRPGAHSRGEGRRHGF